MNTSTVDPSTSLEGVTALIAIGGMYSKGSVSTDLSIPFSDRNGNVEPVSNSGIKHETVFILVSTTTAGVQRTLPTLQYTSYIEDTSDNRGDCSCIVTTEPPRNDPLSGDSAVATKGA